MAYSDFNLKNTLNQFNLKLEEISGLFADIAELAPSEILTTILRENIDLAVSINTEKARSEMIIAPILLEIRRHFKYQISLFSGINFDVDSSQGLNGYCDFLISLSKEQLLIHAPVITIVEAKNENLKAGLAQCMAEMVSAQIFNERQQNPSYPIYGVITIGTIWQFLKLEAKKVSIDLSEYYISDIPKILGILASAIPSVI